MRQFIYINEITTDNKCEDMILEGGLSRNYAIMKWIQSNVKKIKYVMMKQRSVISLVRLFVVLFFSSNNTIFIQYPTTAIPLFSNKRKSQLIFTVFLAMLHKASRKNELVIDVSDLKYEQSIDLELMTEYLPIIKKREEKIFTLNATFVFASLSMMDYAQSKYKISSCKIDFCENGGRERSQSNTEEKYDEIASKIDQTKINVVYSGSLNQGRQIEEMIACFPEEDRLQLILMGSGGEWIDSINLKKNVMYLGPLLEAVAHYIVGLCDIGLIPYNESRLYYQIAYPTKMSFYMTAGIPVLSTPVNETKKCYDTYRVGFIESIDKWPEILLGLEKKSIQREKDKISNVKKKFEWNNIIDRCKTYANIKRIYG